jgi:signal transduction histidine kinase
MSVTEPGGRVAGARARRPLRAASVVIFLVVAGVSVAVSFIAHNVIQGQERLLLKERTGEVAAVLGSAFSGSQASLQLLGTLARTNGKAGFAEGARSATAAGTEVLLMSVQHGTVARVTAVAGHGPAVGDPLPAAQQALARRALVAHGMVSGSFREGAVRWLVFGLGQAAGPGTVVWEEAQIKPSATLATSASSPWANLNIAVYLSARPSPATLIQATTRNLPLAGGIQYPFQVGADRWVLVGQSMHPLVGTLAESIPWIILAIGLIGAVLLTAFAEILGRRRDYAEALAQERTASLRSAMAELEKTQAQLIRQERLAAVGQLASTVGHELRNPLAVVMNVLYLMEATAKEDPDGPMHRHVATAKREISAATLIVSDLLDYSAGREPILAPVRVSDLVDEALSVVPPPAGVQVEQRGEAPVAIEADHDQIRQALLNLITNGYEAMPEGGVLTVAADQDGDLVKITVTDTGSGMDAETQESIFTPFFTKKARGIGLGLAVTKRIVESHHGTITVQSAPSAGTSFTITVPLATPMASVAR